MKRHLVVLAALFVVLAAPLRACDDVEDQAYLLDEILRLSHEGVPDRIIIKQMRTMDFVFCLSAGDIIELRELGVSDDVLEAIIETSLVQQDERERYRETNVTVRLSPGYWSPWYRYPCGWGSYYDPFPMWYSYYYYPFQYECAYSWYGWYPNTYYYSYACYQPRHHSWPHDGNYREEAGLTLASNRPAQLVSTPPSVIPPAGTPPMVAQPVVRGGQSAPRSGYLDAASGEDLNVGRTPYRSTSVTTPPATRASQPTQRRSLTSLRSDNLNVRRPQPATPTATVPTSPRLQTRRDVTPQRTATPPAVTPRVRPRTTTPPPAAPPSAVRSRPASSTTSPRVRFTPQRSATPQKRTATPPRVTPPVRSAPPTRVRPATPPPRPAAPAKAPAARRARSR